MDDRQRRENDRNIRANDFLYENALDFADNAVATAKISRLGGQIEETQAVYQKQIAVGMDVRHNYGIYKDALDALLDEMRGVRDFADSIAQEIAGLEMKFRIPRTGGRGAVINAAYVFAEDAEEYKEKFIDYGMDPDFITELRAKADAAAAALAAAESATGSRAGATGTLEREIKETNKLIESLDPIVRRTYRANPAKLAAWIYASHIERYTPRPRPVKAPE